jgi:hypothetical protein
MATLTDKGIKDGSLIGNPNGGDYYRFMDSNNGDLLTIRDSSGVDTVYGTGGGINQLGWVALTDTTYTSVSPLSISSGVDTVLQFNADSTIDTYAPNGYTVSDFFDAPNNRIISPILGSAYDFRITFKCTPSANSRQLVTKYSIGTGVGSQIVIDQRSSELRTSGTPSNISITSLVYSLSTFLANGMEIILNANTNCDVYDIALVINRTS